MDHAASLPNEEEAQVTSPADADAGRDFRDEIQIMAAKAKGSGMPLSLWMDLRREYPNDMTDLEWRAQFDQSQ